MDPERVRSITLRVAIFFGLTTFTLCIAIFYIESILDDTRDTVNQRDSIIQVMEKDMESVKNDLSNAEAEIMSLKSQLESASTEDADDSAE